MVSYPWNDHFHIGKYLENIKTENWRDYNFVSLRLLYINFIYFYLFLASNKTIAKNLCFWTVVLEKTFESPLDCKINQFILKEISPGCSLQGLMLKLKLQYFSHLMWRVVSLEKTLMLGGIGGRRKRGRQRMR